MMWNVMDELKAKDDQLDMLTVQLKEKDANSKTMISKVIERLKAKDDRLDALTIQVKENETHLNTMEIKLEILDITIVKEGKYQVLKTKIDSLKRFQQTKLLGYFKWNITEFSRKISLKSIVCPFQL